MVPEDRRSRPSSRTTRVIDCVVLGAGPAGLAASGVWATGYVGDFSWLRADLLDTAGRPRRNGTAGVPGLWYLGLRWLTRRSSGNFLGFPTDAAAVAGAVHAHLGRNRS